MNIAIIILCAALAACLLWMLRQRRDIRRLQSQIDAFLRGDIATPQFSVRDDGFAPLENAVIELETRLMQSEENTLQTQREQNDLIVDISHQFKTPIAGLRLYCEMDASAHQCQQLQLIERMEKLITSLLRLEKLRAGGYDFDFQMHSLPELARDAARSMADLFPNRAIDVTGEASVRCDSYWMREVFQNLLKNACEHTANAGHISIAFSQTETSAFFTVEDDGGGVPPEELPKLFRRFYRSANAAAGGVGVGLSIAHAIVERHHGALSAENGAKGLKLTGCLPILHPLLKRT
ncbi:MAG: HAMP domain-containing sensor histidine kinase [Clostridia bacterium]|nr:HAMP domain-containing sensor histidine kinase [Clostridia bacterium]